MTEATNNRTANRTTAAAASAERTVLWEGLQHVSWGAIFLGLVIAIAVQMLLGLLGVGIGLTLIDPTDPMGGIGAWGIGTALYVVITQIIALFLGGYIASRLAPALTAQSAIFHGAAIWALALIATMWLGTTTVGLAVSGLTSAASGVASATTQTVKAVVPDDIGLPDLDFESLPQPLQETLRENNITPDKLRQEVRGAYREAISREEERRLIQQLQQAVQNILQNPTDAPEEIDKAIDNAFGEGGILSEEDFNEIQDALQRRLNLSDQEVEQMTTQLRETAEQARDNMKEAVRTAREQAAETAETITDQIGFLSLWMFIASLLGLIAAVVGGKTGETTARRAV